MIIGVRRMWFQHVFYSTHARRSYQKQSNVLTTGQPAAFAVYKKDHAMRLQPTPVSYTFITSLSGSVSLTSIGTNRWKVLQDLPLLRSQYQYTKSCETKYCNRSNLSAWSVSIYPCDKDLTLLTFADYLTNAQCQCRSSIEIDIGEILWYVIWDKCRSSQSEIGEHNWIKCIKDTETAANRVTIIHKRKMAPWFHLLKHCRLFVNRQDSNLLPELGSSISRQSGKSHWKCHNSRCTHTLLVSGTWRGKKLRRIMISLSPTYWTSSIQIAHQSIGKLLTCKTQWHIYLIAIHPIKSQDSRKSRIYCRLRPFKDSGMEGRSDGNNRDLRGCQYIDGQGCQGCQTGEGRCRWDLSRQDQRALARPYSICIALLDLQPKSHKFSQKNPYIRGHMSEMQFLRAPTLGARNA